MRKTIGRKGIRSDISREEGRGGAKEKKGKGVFHKLAILTLLQHFVPV